MVLHRWDVNRPETQERKHLSTAEVWVATRDSEIPEQAVWRKGRDSNPRGVLPPTRFPVARTRPGYATLPKLAISYQLSERTEC
jgi:hypothetical protein